MNLTERIDQSLDALANEPVITVTQAVDAVLAGGPPLGISRDDLALLVRLRLEGTPLLDGIAGTMQRACERTRAARLPLPAVDELVRIGLRSHPQATEDDVLDALEAFAQHQQAQGARFAAQADMLHVEHIRREAGR